MQTEVKVVMLLSILEDLKGVESNPILAFLSNRGFHALLCYRVSNWLYQHRVPLVPLVLTRAIQILYGIDIDYRAKIGPGCVIVHGVGTVIGSGAVIGSNCRIYHQVTLGIAHKTDGKDGFPMVGDHVLIGAGAKLLGPILVGRYSKIGANSVVTSDVPDWAVAVGVPAKIVKKP